MDNVDEYISNIVRKQIQEPINFENKIRNTLNFQKKHFVFNELVKKIAVGIVSISAIGGIAFAVQLSGIINHKEYVTENNGYIQQLNMPYQTIDNLSIKVESILIDDFNIQIKLDYLYNEPITSANSKILVKDEKKNVLYRNVIVDIEHSDFLLEKIDRNAFVEKPTIIDDAKTKTIYNQDITEKEIEMEAETHIGFQSMYEQINSNHIKRTINLYHYLDTEKFPNSKKIYIQLEDMILRNKGNKVKTIKGKWIFEIDMKEEIRKN